MTESPVKIESYLADIREEIKNAIGNQEFVGSLQFEVNIKFTDITNMNMTIKKSIKH